MGWRRRSSAPRRPSRVATHADYSDRGGAVVDDVVATLYAGPNSYTGRGLARDLVPREPVHCPQGPGRPPRPRVPPGAARRVHAEGVPERAHGPSLVRSIPVTRWRWFATWRTRGVYVLHGDADDNVPVSQARQMREVLGTFHPDFSYHEQPGAGHWWGSACVDWPPLFAFLNGARCRPPTTCDG